MSGETWGPNSWVQPLLERLHVAVSSDSSLTLIHITGEIHTETGTQTPYPLIISPNHILLSNLCLSSYLIVCFVTVASVWFTMSLNTVQVVSVYTKQRSYLTMLLFIGPRKTENYMLHFVWKSCRRAVGRGPFHNFYLVHGAVGWCAVSAWWPSFSQKMSQFIT